MVILEGLGLLIEAIITFLLGIGEALFECIPVFVELKQTLSHCTLVGAWALFLGVPAWALSTLKNILSHQK